MRVDASVVLRVPVETAWRVLVAWEEQPRWMGDADQVRVLGSRREGVGTTIAVRTRVFDVPLFTEVLEVTLWEPPTRLVMAHRSFVRGRGTWGLDPVPGGARFTWTEELRLPLGLLGELALGAYRPFMRSIMGRSLGALRRHTGTVGSAGEPGRTG